MGYTSLSIRKNNSVRKYILFYADYLNEAWLSEVLENETTKIIKQFRCKSMNDLTLLTQYISSKGEVVNLKSGEGNEQPLRIIETRLSQKSKSILRPIGLTFRMIWNRITFSLLNTASVN
jgi:hypothetical protein